MASRKHANMLRTLHRRTALDLAGDEHKSLSGKMRPTLADQSAFDIRGENAPSRCAFPIRGEARPCGPPRRPPRTPPSPRGSRTRTRRAPATCAHTVAQISTRPGAHEFCRQSWLSCCRRSAIAVARSLLHQASCSCSFEGLTCKQKLPNGLEGPSAACACDMHSGQCLRTECLLHFQ